MCGVVGTTRSHVKMVANKPRPSYVLEVLKKIANKAKRMHEFELNSWKNQSVARSYFMHCGLLKPSVHKLGPAAYQWEEELVAEKIPNYTMPLIVSFKH